MAAITTRSSMETIQRCLDALREHFDQHFDRGWLAMLIDDLPLDASLLRRIRELLSLRSVYEEDIPELIYGVGNLRTFAVELHRHLMPVLRDRLGVSGFAGRSARGSSDRVYRQFLCMTFPHNVARLEELTARLDAELAERQTG